jgi:hypothetical protein
MKKLLTPHNLLLTVLSCFFLLPSTALAAKIKAANPITVNCNSSDASIQNAIDEIKPGQKGVIYIQGFCNERVIIATDDITLSGNKDGIGGSNGLTEVIVDGARRIKIEYLEITGEGYGLYAGAGATVDIRYSHIYGNTADGIAANDLSLVVVEYNEIESNGRVANYEAGISVNGGSVVRSKGNWIVDNGYAGVGVYHQSYFRSGPSELEEERDEIFQRGCDPEDPPGVCEDLTSDPIPPIALDCFRGAVCDFRETDITGLLEVGRASYLNASDSIINGDVKGFDGAGIFLKRVYGYGSGQIRCSSGAYANGHLGCWAYILPPTP